MTRGGRAAIRSCNLARGTAGHASPASPSSRDAVNCEFGQIDNPRRSH
jgi:hypothetical protein